MKTEREIRQVAEMVERQMKATSIGGTLACVASLNVLHWIMEERGEGSEAFQSFVDAMRRDPILQNPEQN